MQKINIDQVKELDSSLPSLFDIKIINKSVCFLLTTLNKQFNIST